MGLPNKTEIQGKVEQLKGGMKEKAGQALDDRKLQQEGQAERDSGRAREGFGKAKRKVGEAIEDIGKAVGR